MINILLSTYQSERYLEEQINSILSQTYTEWVLIMRDDGSTDNTIQILNKFKSNQPDKIIILDDKRDNVETIKSYEYLLECVNSEYIMFCDHDDIWIPDKISILLAKMDDMEKNYPALPILIHTDLAVVDRNAKIIHSSFWRFSKLNPQILTDFNYLGVCNGVTGCSIMINRKAKEVCLPFSESARMHDSWIALCVSKYGKIGYVNQLTILYRQHEFNQIGAKEAKGLIHYIQAKLITIKQVIRQNKLQLKMLHELEYGGLLKYGYYKVSYFIKVRL